VQRARDELTAYIRSVTTEDGTKPPRMEVPRMFDRGNFQVRPRKRGENRRYFGGKYRRYLWGAGAE
jgi:hypothetical protein